jgi:hypothetical protein
MNKIIKIKPKLIDYSIINPPSPKKIIINHKENLKFYINLIGIIIIIFLIIMMYDRYKNNEKIKLEKQNKLINFHLYVKENLKNNSL